MTPKAFGYQGQAKRHTKTWQKSIGFPVVALQKGHGVGKRIDPMADCRGVG